MYLYMRIALVVVVFVGIVCAKSLLKRRIKSRHLLQDFFGVLSKEFGRAWTTHHKDTVAKATVARAINLKVRANMGKRFQTVIPQIRYFLPTTSSFLINYPETDIYITTMYDEFRALYKDYKKFGAAEDTLEDEFYKHSEKIILAELEKLNKKSE